MRKSLLDMEQAIVLLKQAIEDFNTREDMKTELRMLDSTLGSAHQVIRTMIEKLAE